MVGRGPGSQEEERVDAAGRGAGPPVSGRSEAGGTRAGVDLTNLDQPLFDGADATKRDLVDYLDAVHERMLPGLRDRPLSVIRVRPGAQAFMQKNLPRSAPPWVRTVTMWAESSRRDVTYALCDDRQTLLWFANQRAVEYHPALVAAGATGPSHMVLDLDPPEGGPFADVVRAARLVQQALADAGLAGAPKTSGSKGLHVYVPLVDGTTVEDAAAATRAVAARAERLGPEVGTTAFVRTEREGKVFLDATRAGGATVVAPYSPRVRPGATVSFPVSWDALDDVDPRECTIRTAVSLLGDGDPWVEQMPEAQPLPADLVAEGHGIPLARVQAMHEGKRRARGGT